jgi:tetratricopeptide (TPR) repeat protein
MDEGAKKNDVLNMIVGWGREPGAVRSRWRYFRACELGEKGNFAEQRKELELGIDSENGDPTDADVLISLYRLPEPTPEQDQKTRELIESAVAQFRNEIQSARQSLEMAPNENQQLAFTIELATASNQMAWLIANTTGDYDEAVQASHRSLELRPDTAAYYDTLGRCYFAKGDLPNAIKYQKQALRLEPHSGQMHRQLEKFEKALAASKKE